MRVRQLLLVSALSIAALTGSFLVSANKSVHAQSSQGARIVTVYDNDAEQVIATDAKTVGEALTRADVDISEYDAVEPGRDTQLIAPNYSINVYRARPVTVVDGAQTYQLMTPYQSPKKIAESAGLKIYDEDILEVERIDDFLVDGGIGLKLTITRSTPLALDLYGKKLDARTQAKTVQGLLKEKKITLGKDDGVEPAPNTPITPNMPVLVYRNGVQVVTEDQEVPFPIEHIQDRDRELGYRQVKEPGTKGRKAVTYQIEMRNGKEVSRKEIQSVVTIQPKKQVEIVGAKPGFSGAFSEALARLRQCEAGGRYDRNSGNGYYGAYQYNISTWANYQGYTYPHEAPPAVQDQKAYETYQRRGWQPWPGCTSKLGLQDIYR